MNIAIYILSYVDCYQPGQRNRQQNQRTPSKNTCVLLFQYVCVVIPICVCCYSNMCVLLFQYVCVVIPISPKCAANPSPYSVVDVF